MSFFLANPRVGGEPDVYRAKIDALPAPDVIRARTMKE
jgi:hypothetical protein